MKTRAHFIALIACIIVSCGPTIDTPTLPPVDIASATARATSVPPTATLTPMPLPSLTPTPSIGSELIMGPNKEVTVFVPAGEFLMGSNEGKPNSAPAHTVYLDSFWIHKIEVTNLHYLRCVDAGGCTAPNKKALPASENQISEPGTRSQDSPVLIMARAWDNSFYFDYPVINVTWEQAGEYCKWAGGRLPTEAEWEKTARGTDGRPFPWGTEEPYIVHRSVIDGSIIPNSTPVVIVWSRPQQRKGRPSTANNDAYAVFFQLNYLSKYEAPQEGGTYPDGISPYGALDMAGNVWEYVSDWYDKAFYANSPLNNPTGPETVTLHIVRGGSWWSDNTTINTYDRVNTTANGVGVLTVGFRCAFNP